MLLKFYLSLWSSFWGPPHSRAVFTYPVLAQEEQHVYLPIIYNAEDYEGKLPSNSYYMITIDDTFLYDLGCEIGTRDQNEPDAQDSVSVLDFSYPICDSELGFGTELFGYGPVSLSDIENAVKNFALGYYTCSGTDNTSNLVMGVGTAEAKINALRNAGIRVSRYPEEIPELIKKL